MQCLIAVRRRTALEVGTLCDGSTVLAAAVTGFLTCFYSLRPWIILRENAQSMGHDVSVNLSDLLVILDMSSREEIKS